MNVFLYRCRICGNALFSEKDNGDMFSIKGCPICEVSQVYEKVVVSRNKFITCAEKDEYEFHIER